MSDLKETVTVTRALTGARKDLAEFVLWLEAAGYICRVGVSMTDENLVKLTSVYWDQQHGEDR